MLPLASKTEADTNSDLYAVSKQKSYETITAGYMTELVIQTWHDTVTIV
jgi:hypothetical protein